MSTPGTAADMLPVLATGVAGAAVFFSTGAYGLVNPRSQMWGPVVWRGDISRRTVALTFDDGPLPGSTDRILDTLGELGVRAAFFVIGRHVQMWPDLVKRIHDEGHVVGNHTFNHSHWGLFGRDRYWQNELRRTDDAIEQIIGVRPAMFRPPMGFKHWHTTNGAADMGHAVVTWSRRSKDVGPTSAEAILARTVDPARGGDVILLHDGNDPQLKPFDRSGTRDAVKPMIQGLRRRGLEPARLDGLLNLPAYQSQETLPAPASPPVGAGGC
jgi:peptidoglycan/xylan/chitin deacetylase (PgdA/CDA1 family)